MDVGASIVKALYPSSEFDSWKCYDFLGSGSLRRRKKKKTLQKMGGSQSPNSSKFVDAPWLRWAILL
jgi:hypothetical protein